MEDNIEHKNMENIQKSQEQHETEIREEVQIEKPEESAQELIDAPAVPAEDITPVKVESAISMFYMTPKKLLKWTLYALGAILIIAASARFFGRYYV